MVALAAVLSLPGAARAQGGVPADVSYATSPQEGRGNQYSAPYQWWKVALTTGEELTAHLAVTSEADDMVYLWLYLPGTTHTSQDTRVASAPFTYTATQTGDYLFCVFSFSREGTAYTFAWTVNGLPPSPVTSPVPPSPVPPSPDPVASPVSRTESPPPTSSAAPVPSAAAPTIVPAPSDGSVPAVVPFATDPQNGIGNQYSVPFQWWKVTLAAGDTLTADLAVTSQPDDEVYLFLYLPGTTHKSQSTRVATAPFVYTASEAGDYLFCVFSFSREGTAFTFAWSVDGTMPPA
jgi:hypothetical protein